jgi:hypothetical protein
MKRRWLAVMIVGCAFALSIVGATGCNTDSAQVNEPDKVIPVDEQDPGQEDF